MKPRREEIVPLNKTETASSAKVICLQLMDQLEIHRRIDLFGFVRESHTRAPVSDNLSIPDPRCSTVPLFRKAGGQMFGVLVCRNSQGKEVILRAFSGQFNGLWIVEGWVSPIIDTLEFNRLLESEDRIIKDLTEKIEEHTEAGISDSIDKRDEPKTGGRNNTLTKLRRERKKISRKLMNGIFRLYTLTNFRGENKSLEQLFSGGRIPTGTGDCCLPKLLNAAVTRGLTPVDGAEFFWGREPLSGVRRHRSFYPPCEEKCQPILGFMTKGLDPAVRERLLKGGDAADMAGNPGGHPGSGLPDLDIIYADSNLAVVNKPSGLLAVPGRGPAGRDCMAARIKAAFPGCPAQPSVHRLDMDTSGLMVFALNPRAHRNLSIQFQGRRVKKEYLAILDDPVQPGQGEIRLSFRLDPENRPRQVWDPERGREGVTLWEFMGQSDSLGCLVRFRPLTGRTHQLRLHASHPFGLNSPIRGDRLYGRGVPGEFLSLHAVMLGFFHPDSGKWMEFHSIPPFLHDFLLSGDEMKKLPLKYGHNSP